MLIASWWSFLNVTRSRNPGSRRPGQIPKNCLFELLLRCCSQSSGPLTCTCMHSYYSEVHSKTIAHVSVKTPRTHVNNISWREESVPMHKICLSLRWRWEVASAGRRTGAGDQTNSWMDTRLLLREALLIILNTIRKLIDQIECHGYMGRKQLLFVNYLCMYIYKSLVDTFFIARIITILCTRDCLIYHVVFLSLRLYHLIQHNVILVLVCYKCYF